LGARAGYAALKELVIFDRNPLDDPLAVLAAKTVIKDGVIVRD
jgi:hypothetical protein